MATYPGLYIDAIEEGCKGLKISKGVLLSINEGRRQSTVRKGVLLGCSQPEKKQSPCASQGDVEQM